MSEQLEQPEELNFVDINEELVEIFPPTDEPELIAELPLGSVEAPEPTAQPASADEFHIAATVCDSCMELNLTTKSVIRCARCEQAFCLHYASKIDVQYCVNCMASVDVTKQVIVKEYIHEDKERGVTQIYRRKAREIKIGGLDWLFAQRKIATLNNTELDMVIEYHRNIMQLLLAEQERKRLEYLHRNAKVKYVSPVRPPSNSDGSVKVTNTKTTRTTTKQTKTMSKSKETEQIGALLGQLKAKGINLNDLAKLINSK